jgi:hypothetical protein
MVLQDRRTERIVRDAFEHLLASARRAEMTPEQREEQRRSFAYGNTALENPRITRQIIDQEAEKLSPQARTVRKDVPDRH